MLGAIIGDIVGSRFERKNLKSKEFELFTSKCCFTDDSVMSLAVAKAILQCEDYSNLCSEAVRCMQELGRQHPKAGYGYGFRRWLFSENPQPYNSWGNGSAMRVSACGFAASSVEEAVELAHKVTKVSHNHPEGMKGAEATAVAVFLAKSGSDIREIQNYINRHYYMIDFKLGDIRDRYRFDVSCQGSVPQALEAFFESTDFEDAIRNAISIGGDSDTIAAITGGVAEAYYGISDQLRIQALAYMSEDLQNILRDFEIRYPPKILA